MTAVLDWAIVIALGVAVGLAELFSRYRDAPVRAAGTLPGFFYLFLNAGAGALALAVIRAFGWTFGATTEGQRWMQILVAGFGSMALFRSSLFSVRVGDQDVDVGPSSILQIVLSAVDRAVDRWRGRGRSVFVSRIMRGVSFVKAQAVLPAYCLALLQNLPKDDQDELSRQVDLLGTMAMDEDGKALLLGLALLNVVGEDVLSQAIETLGEILNRE